MLDVGQHKKKHRIMQKYLFSHTPVAYENKELEIIQSNHCNAGYAIHRLFHELVNSHEKTGKTISG